MRIKTDNFHPRQLDTLLCLDYLDTASISLNGTVGYENSVTQWGDLSPVSNHAEQSTALLQPILSDTGIIFNPDQKLTSINNSGINFVTPSFSFNIVWRLELDVTYANILYIGSEGLLRNTVSKTDTSRIFDPDLISTAKTFETDYITTITYDGITASAYRDGALNISEARALEPAIVDDTIAIMSAHTTGTFNIKSIIIADKAWSERERQLIEGWSAHRYNLLDSLDASNPYKVVRP